MSPWQAHWIWTADADRHPRHQAIVARRRFTLGAVTSAMLRISADTRYRLWINGVWVTDGPGRSWPAHHRYDMIDAAPFLNHGDNLIAVEALHVGFATMQSIAQEAGLLIQLDASDAEGLITTIASDATWRVHAVTGLRADTARMMITMEAVEWRDLQVDPADLLSAACDDQQWPAATAWHAAEAGPWRDLQPREVPQEIRIPRYPIALVDAQAVGRAAWSVGFDLKRMCYAQDRSANFVRMMGVLATVITVSGSSTVSESSTVAGSYTARLLVPVPSELTVFLRGQPVTDGVLRLESGDNLLTIAVDGEGHGYDTVLAFDRGAGLTLSHPWSADTAPWLWIGPFAPQSEPISNAAHTTRRSHDPVAAAHVAQIARSRHADELRAVTAGLPTASAIHVVDPWVDFRSRVVLGALPLHPQQPVAGLLGAGAGGMTLTACASGDREYTFDLGLNSVGYVALDCMAPAGTVIDVMLLEYRFPDGRPQHTEGHRNGLRLVCGAGRTRFISSKRRGGRFVYVIIRDSDAPVQLHGLQLIEARYPAVAQGTFACNDAHLTRIWELSARTLALCMEDTYTDCPLYEQVLWVGDLRHEAQGAHDAFASYDLTLRSLRLAAESLDGLALPGSQVPSGWNVILPAWSLLWVIAVDEYALHSGDKVGASALWPAVERTLRQALACAQREGQPDHGLMSIHAWNFLDWTGIDTDSDTVLHNSLLLGGALQAAQRLAKFLGTGDAFGTLPTEAAWLADGEGLVTRALHQAWDPQLQGWPDCIKANGQSSTSTCQHTAAFGLSYGVLPHEAAEKAALQALLQPGPSMVKVGSPFALHFVLEALLKTQHVSAALAIIRDRWGPMVDAGATSCWETFPGWEKDKPTRSHCHGWSAGPLHLLLRAVLGVRPHAYGWTSAVISPHPVNGLHHASGAVATPHGPLRVTWHRTGNDLNLTIEAPTAITWQVQRNSDWRDLHRITVNGNPWNFM